MSVKIFFCYAHEDEALRQALEKQLRILKRQSLINVWHDRQIGAGTEWEEEIFKQLNSAQIILLLVSPDFIDSDYCYGKEMQLAMERHQRGEAQVIPVILRPVYWRGTPFGKLQALPKDAIPVVSPLWHNLDEAFFNVAEGLRKEIETLIQQPMKNIKETQHEKDLAESETGSPQLLEIERPLDVGLKLDQAPMSLLSTDVEGSKSEFQEEIYTEHKQTYYSIFPDQIQREKGKSTEDESEEVLSTSNQVEPVKSTSEENLYIKGSHGDNELTGIETNDELNGYQRGDELTGRQAGDESNDQYTTEYPEKASTALVESQPMPPHLEAPQSVIHPPDQSDDDIADVPFFPNPEIKNKLIEESTFPQVPRDIELNKTPSTISLALPSWGIEQPISWNSLSNPFTDDRPQVIAGHVSCRSTEIHDFITGQNALLLVGGPNIGKSMLIRYLQLPPDAPWSWRDELEREWDVTLNAIHFTQIDLKPLLVNLKDEDKLLDIFIKECTKALFRAYKPGDTFSDLTLRGLYKLLNIISKEATEETRYFLILDNIDRLGFLYMQLASIKRQTKKPQEYGITLLDRSRAIRTIIDLIDEFKIFGFILSIESLPKAGIMDQFTHISADLARFTTKTLQTFSMSDTRKFLAQPVKDFRTRINERENDDSPSSSSPLFTLEEQSWLLGIAGTHPYLVKRCCYYLFQFKAYSSYGAEMQNSDKELLLSIIYEKVSTFLSRTWQRLQEAISSSTDVEKIDKQFQAFVSICAQKETGDAIEAQIWDNLHPELRYILYSEGIIRFDLFRPIQFPGRILCDYLVRQVKERNKTGSIQGMFTPAEHGRWLHITRPGMEIRHMALSKLEYRLLKTLLQHAHYCTEQELIQSAWEKGTERANFTQRLYKLRKKLEEQLDGIDMIENRYGGIYSLTHPEWLDLD